MLVALPAESAKKQKSKSAEELINVLLSPDRAQWLVGPIALIAAADEVAGYLALDDDSAADDFIDRFWDRRKSSDSPFPGTQPRDIFEKRARMADRLFAEGTHLGRRTPRGEIYVVYGPPDARGYVEEGTLRRPLTVEIWRYRPSDARGLDGRAPNREYSFAKRGDLTVRHNRQRRLQANPTPGIRQ